MWKWKDLNTSQRRFDKEKIAVITFKNRIAQRKFEDRVVWERIDKSTPLYNGDLVRTSDLAEAVITFNDNSQIDLFENTMIQVYYSDTEGISNLINFKYFEKSACIRKYYDKKQDKYFETGVNWFSNLFLIAYEKQKLFKNMEYNLYIII